MSEPARSRTRAFTLTLLTGQGLTMLTLAVAFLATPVLVRSLGAERYGMWRVLEAWVLFVGVIPLCVTHAGGFLLVPLLSERDPERLRRFAATLAVVGGAVAAAVSVAGLVLVPALPWIASGPEELAGERLTAFLIALLAAAPLAPLLLLRCVLEADQKGYLINAVIAAQSLTVTGVAVWLAVGGAGLPGQAVAVSAGAAVQALLFALLAYRRYSWARPGRPSRADAVVLLRRASGLFALAFLGGIAARADYLLGNLTGAWDGPTETASYNLGQRLFLVYAGLVAAIGNSIWAPAADLYHRGQAERLREQLGRAVRGTAAVAAAGVVAIAAVTPEFLRLWVGEGYDPGDAARWGFAVHFPLLGVNILLSSVLTATGHTRAMFASSATYCVATLGGVAWLGSLSGPGGVAWGMALGVGAAVVTNVGLAGAAFGVPPARVALSLLTTAALGIPYALGLAELLSLAPGMGWAGVIAALAAGWAGFLALGWFLILTREDRDALRSRLRGQ